MTDNDLRRAYRAMKVTDYHRRMKLRAIEYKGGKCQRCGYSKSPAAMTFHHRDPKEKDFTISSKVLKWERLQPELDKCELLCGNCHQEEHERQFNLGREELRRRIRAVVAERTPAIRVTNTCPVCLKAFMHKGSTLRLFCGIPCSAANQQETQWPAKEELEALLKQYPATTIAAQLGVSSVAVKKRCKRLGIETKGRGFWARR